MKRLLIFASTLMLLLTGIGTAIAAPTQNWNDFLADWSWSTDRIDPTSPETEAHTLLVGQTEEALDVALTVEGLYYDGETFLLGFRTENLQPLSPALILYTAINVNGVFASPEADYPTSQWFPWVFGLNQATDPNNNLMWGFRADMNAFRWSGEVEISAHFTVVKPTKPLVIVDADIHNAYDNDLMEIDRQIMINNLPAYGITLAEADDTDVDGWRDKGYIVVNRYGDTDLIGDFPGREHALYEFIEIDSADSIKQEVVITFHVNLDELAK